MSTMCFDVAQEEVASRSAALRRRLELVWPPGSDSASRMRAHTRAGELYPSWLMLQHMIGRGRVPLLRSGGREALRRAAAGDPVAAPLVDYFRRQAEGGWQEEECLIDDYVALDRDADDVVAAVPWPTAAALVGAAYYWVLHHHPVALLGYFAALDGDRPSAAVVAELSAATRCSGSVFATLRQRADDDPAGRADLWRLIDVLPMGSVHVEVVTRAATLSAELLTRALDELWNERLGGSA
jgi:hypothetical protein